VPPKSYDLAFCPWRRWREESGSISRKAAKDAKENGPQNSELKARYFFAILAIFA
jgi:hypothetical protein